MFTTALISAVAAAATVAGVIKAKQIINEASAKIASAIPTQCILDEQGA